MEEISGLQEPYKHATAEFMAVIIKIYVQAKQQKNYEQIDTLRAELRKLNITLQDSSRRE